MMEVIACAVYVKVLQPETSAATVASKIGRRTEDIQIKINKLWLMCLFEFRWLAVTRVVH